MPIIKFTPTSNKIKTVLTGSKSISNRLLMISAIGNFLPDFKNLSKCDDVKFLHQILHSNAQRLDVHDSGTALRFLTAFMSGIVGEWHLTGSERIQQRPIKPLVDVLLKMGANIIYDKKVGYAPLTITGTKMQGGSVAIDISESSQYASALLLIAPMLENGLKLTLKGEQRSLPYINITLDMMQYFGVDSMRYDGELVIMPGQEYTKKPYTVEADWSAASFWYELVALNPEMSIKVFGLNEKSTQGDKAVAKIFEKLGVNTQFGAQHTTISASAKQHRQPLNIDIRQTPDLFPPVAVACMAQKRPLKITGTANLALKESHRIGSVKDIAEQLGIAMKVDADQVTIDEYPQTFPGKVKLSAAGDHRIAMVMGPLSTIIPEIEIDDPAVVSKSYPEFWEEMKKAGIEVK